MGRTTDRSFTFSSQISVMFSHHFMANRSGETALTPFQSRKLSDKGKKGKRRKKILDPIRREFYGSPVYTNLTIYDRYGAREWPVAPNGLAFRNSIVSPSNNSFPRRLYIFCLRESAAFMSRRKWRVRFSFSGSPKEKSLCKVGFAFIT